MESENAARAVLDILALGELRGVLGHDLPVLQGLLSVVLGQDRVTESSHSCAVESKRLVTTI